MVFGKRNRWLVLIHQIPPKPDALRVKIWRRLQQIGAVAIKQSVYVMPFSEQSREDLGWTLKEIVDGGGDGSISELRFLEGLSDEHVIALFQKARKSDYEKIINDANQLLAEWSSNKLDPKDPNAKVIQRLEKLQRRLDSIVAIDFFKAHEGKTAKLVVKDLFARSSGDIVDAGTPIDGLDTLQDKIWVTRRNLFVDRIACGWLVRRFIDASATFKYVDPDSYAPLPGEICFDMYDGEFTHEGDRCTFEVMIKRLGLLDRGLTALAEVIHDIDLKDGKYKREETEGLNALLTGLAEAEPDDDVRMTKGAQLIENLYTYFKSKRR